MKNILIVNQYASTPETGMGGRHYHMARELAKQGYRVCLVAAGFTHLLRNPPECDKSYIVEHVEGFDFLWIRVPSYPDAHSKKRIFNWFLFAYKLYGLKKVLTFRPDAILCSSPSLISFFGAKRLAKSFSARLSFEVRDIWPLTLVDVGGFSPNHPFIRFLQWVEDRAYRDSERVVSNLKYSVEHMITRGMDEKKFAWIPNGFSMDEVSQAQKLSDEIIAKLPNGKFVIGYTGTIGVANALVFLIEAAEILKNQTEIAFVIVGDGREKANLECLVKTKGLHNVFFTGPIPKVQIQSILEEFDACFIGLTNDPLFRFGVSPNKLFDYFVSAKPVIYAIESGKYKPVDEADAGFQVPADDPESIAEAVLRLYRMPLNDREIMGKKGRKFALQNHEYAELSRQLVGVMVGDND